MLQKNILFVLGVSVIFLTITFLPNILVVNDLQSGILGYSDIWTAELEYRKLILQVIAGGVVIFGTIVAFRRMKATELQLVKTEEQIQLVHKGQVNDRFSRAVELLSNEKIPVRVGALITLEEIAYESENLTKSVFKIIQSFVNRNANKDVVTETHADINEAFEILIKLSQSNFGYRIFLKNVLIESFNYVNLIESKQAISINISDSILKNFRIDNKYRYNISIVNSQLNRFVIQSNSEKDNLVLNHCLLDGHCEIKAKNSSVTIVGSLLNKAFVELGNRTDISESIIGDNSALFSESKKLGRLKNIKFHENHFSNYSEQNGIFLKEDEFNEEKEEWIKSFGIKYPFQS